MLPRRAYQYRCDWRAEVPFVALVQLFGEDIIYDAYL